MANKWNCSLKSGLETGRVPALLSSFPARTRIVVELSLSKSVEAVMARVRLNLLQATTL